METGILAEQSASVDGAHKQFTVLDLFEQQVQKTPHHIAVQYEAATLTYRELDEKSNQLANYLIMNNISINQYVMVRMESITELSITFWGIMKAGAIYVPIEQDISNAKMQQIQNETKSSLCFTKLPQLNAYSKTNKKINSNKSFGLCHIYIGLNGQPKRSNDFA